MHRLKSASRVRFTSLSLSATALALLALGCEGPPAGAPGAAAPEDVDTVQNASLDTSSTDIGLYYRVRSVSSNAFCADVTGKATTDGTTINQYTCSSGENQKWYFRQVGTAMYQLSAKHSAKCMRIDGASTANGGKLVQEPCARTGTANDGTVFTLTKVGSASPAQYQLKNATSGKCLRSPGTTNNTQITQQTCATTTNFLWTLEQQASTGNSDTAGRFSQVYPLANGQFVAISAALLPNRKVILWASWKGLRFGGSGSLDQTATVLFDPANPGTTTVKTITNTTHNMFCPATAMLADGRVLVNGGDDVRTDATSIYNYATDSWSKGAAMSQQRWYNTSVTLPDGRALTLGGNRTSGASGNGEIYDPVANTWTIMNGITDSSVVAGADDINRAMEHTRMFVAPDGRIFSPGPQVNMLYFTTSGSGSVTSAGTRGDDEFSQNDVTVMIDQGKFLKAGGNPNYDRTNAPNYPSSQNSYIIDINGGTPVVTKIAPMKYPRAFANGVVLPNGKVFVNGGLDNGKGFSDDGAIRASEMFDPATNTWTETATMATSRPYHSFALLLADARVLVGGGGLCSSSDNCAVNHPNVEIYSPPYLYGAARPTIATAPTTVTANGGTFAVTTTGTVTGFSLIRMASVTHTVDTDQRFIKVTASGGGSAWTLTAPANKNLAPPGYYMLFALNGDVPSVAAIMKLN